MKHGISIDHETAKSGNILRMLSAGIAAGMIMGVFGFSFHILGWMQKSGMLINASMVLPSHLLDTALMPIAGMTVHMVFSAAFAVVFYIGFVVYRYLALPGNIYLLGFLYGIVLFIVNAGIIAPVMNLHAPFWQMPAAGVLSSFAARLIYSMLTVLFLRKWVLFPEFAKK
ncbi:hypothetical protein [Spirochaeta dissipatitropha]